VWVENDDSGSDCEKGVSERCGATRRNATRWMGWEERGDVQGSDSKWAGKRAGEGLEQSSCALGLSEEVCQRL